MVPERIPLGGCCWGRVQSQSPHFQVRFKYSMPEVSISIQLINESINGFILSVSVMLASDSIVSLKSGEPVFKVGGQETKWFKTNTSKHKFINSGGISDKHGEFRVLVVIIDIVRGGSYIHGMGVVVGLVIFE